MISTPKGKKSHKSDILLVGALIIALIVGVAFYMITKKGGDTVIVKVSGETVSTYKLSDNINTLIKGKDGGSNRLMISDGNVWLQDATCPDKLCEGMGKIHTSGDSIVCLPNEVVVEIHGDDEDDIDIVSK